jgi:hypothetical protein
MTGRYVNRAEIQPNAQRVVRRTHSSGHGGAPGGALGAPEGREELT